MNCSDSIVIVGGGSSGWMTASSLSQFFPNKKITVIESPDIPRIGVGESTLEHFTFWLHSAGIDPTDLFRYCDGTYKLSIKFNQFYKKDDKGFHYPFGSSSPDKQIFQELGINAFQYLKWKYPELPNSYFADSYWPAVALCHNNTISFNKNREFANLDLSRAYAFHFDAIMFADYLRDHVCIPRGVQHISSTVTDINLNDDGIESVQLKNGDLVHADLFIDCTGFKSLLLNKLKSEWISYSDIIPNNRAWTARVPYNDIHNQMKNYTDCTALGNGWVWNTPTWSRIGTGYVYSDHYTTPDDALLEFTSHLKAQGYKTSEISSYNDVHFRNGVQKDLWIQNCVAVGLSAGFIEPLESTGLFTTITTIDRLTEILNDDGYNQFQVNEFNILCRSNFDGLAKFTASHYMFTQRDDTKYWKDCRTRDYNTHLLPYERNMPPLHSHDYYISEVLTKSYFDCKDKSDNGTSCIMNGMNHMSLNSWQITKDAYYGSGPSLKRLDLMLPDILEKSDQRIQRWNDLAKISTNHYEYLRKTYWDSQVGVKIFYMDGDFLDPFGTFVGQGSMAFFN